MENPRVGKEIIQIRFSEGRGPRACGSHAPCRDERCADLWIL